MLVQVDSVPTGTESFLFCLLMPARLCGGGWPAYQPDREEEGRLTGNHHISGSIC